MRLQNTNSLEIKNFPIIFDNFKEAVFIKDKAFRHIYVNPAFLSHLEYPSQKAVLGKPAVELWPEFASDYQRHDLDTIKGEIYYQLDNIHTNHGERCFALTQKNPIKDNAGNILGIICRSNLFFNENLSQLWSSIQSLTPTNSLKIKATNPNILLNEYSLTAREEECLFYTLQNKSVKAIAKLLAISPRTVETHIANIKLKWGISTKEDLFEKANLHGYIKTIPFNVFRRGSLGGFCNL